MRAALATTWTIIWSLIAHNAKAFGTLNGDLHGLLPPEQHAEHERITRVALGCSADHPVKNCFHPLSLDELAGKKGTVGAVGPPDLNEVCRSEAHCDDADFFNGTAHPSRAEATAKLQECLAHIKGRYQKGLDAAATLLNDDGEIDPDAAAIPPLGCIYHALPPFGHPDLLDSKTATAPYKT